MKKILIIILLLLLIPSVLAINLQIEKTSSNEALIVDINKPVTFNLEVTNLESGDDFSFYNLLGFQIFPVGTTTIGTHQTKTIKLELLPLGEIKERGFYTFNYFIKGTDGTSQQEKLTFKIIELKDAFEVGSGDVDPDSNTLEIFIKNKEGIDFGNISVDFKSAFFKTQETINLSPKEKKTFTISLNKDDFRDLMAGYYTLTADVSVGDKNAQIEGLIKFKEKDLLTTTKKDYGFLVNTQIVEKTNEGNLIADSETVVKKNIISRLFTSISPEPDIVEREGAKVYYTWTNQIKPGETLTIIIKTNWLFPLIVIIFLVAIVVFVKKYSGTNLVLRKRVSFVRAKGGEFALKVSVHVNAKKYLERVNIVDRLPPLVKIYEKFGSEKPTRIDEKTRRIEWNFEKLEPGEIRVLSYVIYSKVGVMGKFALPTATAIFEREGEIHEAESNRAYFVTEPRTKDEE